MVPVLLYISHPFGPSVVANKPEVRASAAARLTRWVRWCFKSTSSTVGFVSGMDAGEGSTVEDRARAARGNLDTLAKCDGVVLVGNASELMKVEREAAEKLGLVVIDLSYLGNEPPHPMPEEFFPVYEKRSAVA